MIKAMSGGWGAMCGALDMTRDQLENRIYERKGQGVLSDLAMAMQGLSGTTFYAEAVSTASGGVFLKLPIDAVDCPNEDIGRKGRALYTELGDLMRHFDEAVADDIIDKRERALLEANAARAHKVLAELVALMKRAYCPPDDAEDA